MASADVQSKVDQVLELFTRLEISHFQPISYHEPVNTAEAQLAALGGEQGIAGKILLKNLVVKDKKKRVYLVSVEHSRQVDLKKLAKLLPGAGALRFLDSESMQSLLGVGQGQVTPLAVLNDASNQVQVLISKTAFDASSLLLHPLTNEATVSIAPDQLESFVVKNGNMFQVIDLDKEVDKSKEPSPKPKQAAKSSVKASGHAVSLGIDIPKTSKTFGDWYSQVVLRSEMIDYYDVSGCYILRPWSYFIWEKIQQFLNAEIQALGVQNSYFPIFVSNKALSREQDHVEGFAPEVAWVTKAGNSDLDEPLAVRPTSETVMYPLVSKWIRSHRDLPMRLNQWSNVVRWEFKNPTPFIRSREFLWQEGHTAFATQEEADKEVREILALYVRVYEELLACPIISGVKTEKEKFAGALYTTTAEAFVPTNGRGVQGATSHCLGQNFAKMFNIQFEDEKGAKHHVWQNSWGLTTRTIGVMVMVHADDKGLVLPPRVAPTQVIIVPIYFKKQNQNEAIDASIHELSKALQGVGVRTDSDKRTIYNPGWKYNHWELKGVPLRVEIGPRDVENKSVIVVRRDTGDKETVAFDALCVRIPVLLETMQREMLERARAASDKLLVQCTTWTDFMEQVNRGKRVLVPFCEAQQCEKDVAERSRAESEKQCDQAPHQEDAAFETLTGAAKSLCIPFEQPPLPAEPRCFMCAQPAKLWTMFGRSY